MRRLLLGLFLLLIGVAATSAQPQQPAIILPGTTPIIGTCTNGYRLYNNAGVVDCVASGGGTLPVANGGTNCSTATITCFNNITGFSAAGTTGTTTTNLVFSTSPTLVTPTLGVATATTINGNTFTTGTYTLTGVAGKTLTFNKTLTLDGTDSTTMTFPSTSATIARTDAAQTFTGVQTFGAGSAATPSLVVGNSTTGIYSVSTTGIGLTVNGTSRVDYGIATAGAVTLTPTAGLRLANSSGGYIYVPLIAGSGGGYYLNGSSVFGAIFNIGGADTWAIGTNATLGGTTPVQVIGYNASGTITFGPVDAATPTAQTLRFQSASTVNNAGVNATIVGSLSRGSGTSGDLIFQTGVASGVSGTAATATTAMTIKGETQAVNHTGIITTSSTTDSTTTTSGALQIAGGAAIRKRVFMDGLTTTTASQTGYICQASTGEIVSDTSAVNLCVASSRDYKRDIEDLGPPPGWTGAWSACQEISRLRPVAFRYKADGRFNNDQIVMGLIAEETAPVDSRIIGFAEGKPRSVQYEFYTALLTKCLQERAADNDNLREEIEELKRRVR